ncbi:MAG TPA: bifunctional precorrin-2 dehydrogenase/sirohydrochlorin ferrochelatase [Nitriliruptorales bacterium]|nr:bifunctional precorrin-2 dehydrogenase/sirohydrochlorin ferrochelatase [Nitriliruptorales bacterium]
MTFAFPMSLDVAGRRCVVVGGGPLAAAKARALVEAGAEVVVLAAEPTAALPEGVRHVPRGYRPGDLAGAFVAVVSGEDDPDVEAAWQEAERERVLLNVVDDVPHCHFAFPAVVRRGDLRVAISTGGKAPALAARLRRALEAQLGDEYGRLVDLLGEVRSAALPRSVPFEEWARRWQAAVADHEALAALVAAGDVDTARDRIRASVTGEAAR